jgi:hypothetical protein
MTVRCSRRAGRAGSLRSRRRLARIAAPACTALMAPPHPLGPGGCTAEQRKSLVGGHLVGMKRPAERQLHRFADACVVGDVHHDGSPVGHSHRESGEPRSRRSTRTCAPSARKATASASVSRVTSAGFGVNRSTSCVGRSTKIIGEHRATSGQGNLPGFRQREGNPGDLLVQRIQAHEATTPSRGSHTCRTCGGSHSRGQSRSSSSRLT